MCRVRRSKLRRPEQRPRPRRNESRRRRRTFVPRRRPRQIGHRFKLDLSHVSAEQFAAARRAYHLRLQEEFFAAHRIAGTETYLVKRGDSLWVIAQQHADLPVWLVAQYNPDVDFNDVRPGSAITLPRVELINRQ